MSNLTRSFQGKRLVILAATISAALLAGAVRTPAAQAENVPNPNPALIARWEPCEPNTGVTEIVDDQKLSSGMIYVGCALGEQANGVEALQHAGFQLEGTTDYGLAFICRIDGEPTPTETPCTTTPGGSAYWSYWRGKPGGRWSFSGVGAKSPQSRSPVNSVEGWSFGGGNAPRIEPMDGSGPSVFTLPAAQESSVIPAALAREWLVPVLNRTAALAEELEAKKIAEHPEAGELLPGAIALARAGASPAEMTQIATWLARGCEEKHVEVEGCPLRELAGPKTKYPERLALAVLGLQALGQNPASFAGRDLREELEEMVSTGTGEVKSEGSLTKDIEATAPTALALALTGALPERVVKTVGLIVGQQNTSTGGWGATTAVSAEAIEALVAAREQGAGVLGQSRLEQVEVALQKAGGYLESIQEAGGGVRESESAEAVSDPSVRSTSLGAVGLALSGRQVASERAAKWVSRYQVTAEYAGTGDPETNEATPAEDLIGAFLPGEAALRNALAYGIGSDNAHGFYVEARSPTIDALLALATAGPYGPYDVSFQPQSLPFETRLVGSQSSSLTATLTNHDIRAVTIAGVVVASLDAGDFSLQFDSCAGRTLASGESCALSAGFDPTSTGALEAQLQVTLAGTAQTIELPLSGTADAQAQPQQTSEAGSEGPVLGSSGPPLGSQGVLSSRTADAVRVQTPHLDGQGTGRGLVGVSWLILEQGVGLRSWTISSRTLGVAGAGYVTRQTGSASATSTLVALPAGAAYELRIAFTDSLGRTTTVPIGRTLVPYDDRSSRLRFRGRWQRLKQARAWLETVSRGGAGAEVSLTLGAGHPVFLLRATRTAASVEVRFGSHRQVFAVARGPSGASRLIAAAARSHRGAVTLRVLQGTVELDGVADDG